MESDDCDDEDDEEDVPGADSIHSSQTLKTTPRLTVASFVINCLSYQLFS